MNLDRHRLCGGHNAASAPEPPPALTRSAGAISTFVLRCLGLAAVLTLGACSVVFTAGVSGRVVDAEEFADDPATGGVNGVKVYLYMNQLAQSADLDRFTNEGVLPDDGGNYYLATVTETVGGQDGAFSFPTIYWNDLLPRYGRSGDRREVHLLLYYWEYGLVEHTATIVSDTTNTLAPVELTSLFADAAIEGRVERLDNAAGVGGVTVTAYVAQTWDGTAFIYEPEPTDEVTTDGNGDYSIDVTFLRDLVDSAGGTRALLTFSADDFTVSTSVDGDLTEDYDADGDGTTDVSYRTPLIGDGETVEAAPITIKQTSFTEQLDGRVAIDTAPGDGLVDGGINGARVFLYVNPAAAPGPGDPADFTTTTANEVLDTNVEAGWFSFAEVRWDDTTYSGNQSSIICYLDVDTDGDGTIDVDNQAVIVYSNTSNTTQVVIVQ